MDLLDVLVHLVHNVPWSSIDNKLQAIRALEEHFGRPAGDPAGLISGPASPAGPSPEPDPAPPAAAAGPTEGSPS